MKTRETTFNALQQQPNIDVLIIGGGVNGIGTYRDLALQGVRVLLVDQRDYCSGGSAASSHMLHGGVRYLENGEFRLVREALHERDNLIRNAPHYAKPQPTTIPLFKWFSGFFNAPLKFLGLLERPSERGALVIKIGLMLYDAFVGSKRIMPIHQFRSRKASLEKFPSMSADIICAATYYDGLITSPERLCIEMLNDVDALGGEALALNYAKVTLSASNEVVLHDLVGNQTLTVRPEVVINAAGAWIDFANEDLQQKTRFIGGTKGSHIVVNHPELLKATGGSEIFFENNDGRIVLILPYLERVLIGTTDIRIDNPDDAVCTDEEIDYMLALVKRIFPNIQVDRSHIVYQFSGVRPLPASETGSTGTISRDHSIKVIEATPERNFPILSLVGGKWTTFRAFSEQAADQALERLGKPRKTNTVNLAIGGGKDYPIDTAARFNWLSALQPKTSLSLERLEILFERYGTYTAQIATFISDGNDQALASLPTYSRREIAYLVEHEQVIHLEDFLLRRSLIAMSGALVITPESLGEIADILAETLQWDATRKSAEIERVRKLIQR